MARSPKPWWWKERQSWFVTIAGKRHKLGPHREAAFQRFHELMAKPQQRAISTDSVFGIFDAFLEWSQRHRAPRTYEWYKQRLEWFAKSIPNLTVGQLRVFHVQQWVDSHPTWSDGHTRGCITAVQRAFRWAFKQGYIDTNPVQHIEKPKAGTREQVITKQEFDTIVTEP